MAKRYYICDIIGDGSEEEGAAGMFRPAVADFPVDWVASIETGLDGKPIHTDCVVLVNTEDHTQLRKDNRIDPLPDFMLDGKLSAINATTKSAMINALRRRGFTTEGIDNADGYRDVLQQIGRQRSAAFNIDKFDIR